MEKMVKFLLICLGVIVMSFQTELFAQEAYQVEAPNGEIRLEDLPDNREGALAMSSVLVPLDRLRNPVLKILIPPGKITEFFTTNRDAKLVGNTIHITKKGKYNTEIRLDGQDKDNSFYVNYKAYFFYGKLEEINKMETKEKPSDNLLVNYDAENLKKYIGVPSGAFPTSWWYLSKDSANEGIEIREDINAMTVEEILVKAKELYPDHQGMVFLRAYFSDGLDNYDPVSNKDFDTSMCFAKIELPPPPEIPRYQLNLVPQGRGQLLARVDGQLVHSGDKVQSGKEVFLEVRPDPGYRLKVRSLKVVDTQGRSIPVRDNGFEMPESNVTVSAEFELIPPPAKKQYAISFSHEGEGSLLAKVDNQPINSGDLIEEGKTVVFTATPADKWRIKNWEPENGTNQEYRIISLSQAASVKVVFEPVPTPPPPAKKQYAISFSHEGEGSLLAKVDNQPINSGDLIEEGKTVVFTANPAEKWRIKNWEPENGTNQEYRIVSLSQATSVKVVFEPVPTPPPPAKKQYAISFSHEGEGSLLAKVDNQPINSGDLVEEGKTVVFTANPAEKWRIKNWEPENGTNQEYRIVSLSQAASVKVVFEPVSTPPVKVDHSVTVAPLQNGTIVATPAKAKVGDQVQLKVNPAVGYRLKEGSLTVTSVGNQTISVLDNRFIMPDAEVNIIAEFEPIPLDPETLLPHLTGIDTTPLKKGTGYTFVWEEMEKTATNFTLELIDTKTHKQVTNLVSSVDANKVQLQFSQVGVFDFKIKFEVAGKAYFVSWRIIVE